MGSFHKFFQKMPNNFDIHIIILLIAFINCNNKQFKENRFKE